MTTGKWYFNSITAIKDAVAEARAEAIKDARGYPCVYSRGTFLATIDPDGQCAPAPEAECPVWKGSMREINELVDEVLKDYPKVTEIYIAGGYDGADSPIAYREWGDYDPWVSAWSVTIWERSQ